MDGGPSGDRAEVTPAFVSAIVAIGLERKAIALFGADPPALT
jgi:hypothetical protein